MRTIFTTALHSTFARSILVAATVGATAAWGTIAMAQTQVPQEMRTQAMSLAQICRNDYQRPHSRMPQRERRKTVTGMSGRVAGRAGAGVAGDGRRRDAEIVGGAPSPAHKCGRWRFTDVKRFCLKRS